MQWIVAMLIIWFIWANNSKNDEVLQNYPASRVETAQETYNVPAEDQPKTSLMKQNKQKLTKLQTIAQMIVQDIKRVMSGRRITALVAKVTATEIQIHLMKAV